MTKITAVVGTLFMVTCLSLAALSTAQGRSVIDRLPASIDQLPFTLPSEPAPAPAAPEPSSALDPELTEPPSSEAPQPAP